jgi:phosphoglycerol transferase MdoB-like AlkP superfamily enzyme
LRQPFFLEMVTMTMHTPYTDGKVPPSWISRSDTLNAEARGYLNCVHLTDSCIGAFIDNLHRHGLAGNTIVAIVSDHTQLTATGCWGKPIMRRSPTIGESP